MFDAKKNGESVLSPFSEPVVVFLLIFVFLIIIFLTSAPVLIIVITLGCDY